MAVTSQNKEKFEDYEGFVEKFKPKLTTDDCYTPPIVYDAVAERMNKLLQGDCLELMKDIPDGSVDMILCDLPYGTAAARGRVSLRHL